MRSFVGDLRNEQDVTSAMAGVDAVIHAGGLVSFGTFPDLEKMEEVNVKGESFVNFNLDNNKNYFQGGKTAFVLLNRNSDETVEEINM